MLELLLWLIGKKNGTQCGDESAFINKKIYYIRFKIHCINQSQNVTCIERAMSLHHKNHTCQNTCLNVFVKFLTDLTTVMSDCSYLFNDLVAI